VLGLVFFFFPLTNELIIFVSFAKKEQIKFFKKGIGGKEHFFENELPSP
jgi:hypothetical protein